MSANTKKVFSGCALCYHFSVESICYRLRICCRQITFGKYAVEELDAKSPTVRLQQVK